MKKITLLLCFMLPLAGFAQATCATAAVATPGGNTVVAAVDGPEIPTPDCSDAGQDQTTASVWYTYTATITGVAIISSGLPENEGGDTRIYVYTGTCGSLTCLGFDDDIDPAVGVENYLSEVVVPITAGETYYLAWDDFWSADGFTFSIIEAPVDCSTSIGFSSTFDDLNVFSACYTKVDGDANGVSWIQQNLDLDADGTDETFATNGTNGDVAKDDWLFTPALTLEAGETYTITYTYNGAGDTANETLEAVVADSPSPTATFLQGLGADSGITMDGTFEELLVNATTQTREFTAPAAGDYRIGFHTTSPPNSGFLLLFEYTIEVSLAAPHFQAGKISMWPNPVANELNIANENIIDSVEVYNLMGQKVLGQTCNTNEVNVNMAQLSSGAYMVKISSANATSTMKVIKQ